MPFASNLNYSACMGICGAKSSKPFRPGQKAMERMEIEELEANLKVVDDQEAPLGEGQAQSVQEEKPLGVEGIIEEKEGLKHDEIDLKVTPEKKDEERRPTLKTELLKKVSMNDPVAVKAKNSDDKKKSVNGLSRESSLSNDFPLTNRLSRKSSAIAEQVSDPRIFQRSKDETQEFRLIKMQSGDSMKLFEPASKIFRTAKQPQPKDSAIQPGKPIGGEKLALSLTANPVLPAKIVSTPNIEDRLEPVEEKNYVRRHLSDVKVGFESKPTTAQDKAQNRLVNTLPVEAHEEKAVAPLSNKLPKPELSTPKQEPVLNREVDQLAFPTIKELTEPEASGQDRRSGLHLLELSSRNRAKPLFGESSLNFHLTVSPNTDKNLLLLKQNLEDRNEIVAKPNFSSALLSKDVLQIIKMEEVVTRRDELNKEIILLDMKKHEELYDMVRTDQFRHSQTEPSRVAGGWMEFEAEGEAWKDRP